MNRNEEMNNFLMYFQELYYYNPNFEINRKTIYRGLMDYGFNQEELKDFDISNCLPAWINRFSTANNLNVFYTERQPGFLQFQNVKGKFDYKCAKIYVSYPKDKIYDYANKIFDYIQQNNLSTLSKISNVIRSDSIVLRMENTDDARRVINFINNDLELSQNAKSTNPFLVRDGVVGMAYDDMMSFNGVLSELLASYFQRRRDGNMLNVVSVADFKNYVVSEYSRNFRDASNIQNFEMSYNYIQRCGGRAQSILNYEQVYKTIIMSLDDKTNSNDILNAINNYKDVNNSISMIRYYDSVLEAGNYNFKNNSTMDSAKDIIDDYILYAASKYGNSNVAMYLYDYMRGNQSAITRDNNYRNLFIKNIPPYKLQEIVNNDLRGYIDTVCNKKQSQNKKEFDMDDAKAIIDGYILLAATKYGVSNVSMYLNDYMRGNQSCITRDNNYRNLFINYVPPTLIPMVVGYDIDSYVQSVIMQYYSQNQLNQGRAI